MSDKNTWDYRVVRKELKDGSNEWLSVQEVYYDDETGEPYAQTIDLMVEGDTITEMRTMLERMINSLGQPILDEIQSVEMPAQGESEDIQNVIREAVEDEDVEQWKKDVLKRGGI